MMAEFEEIENMWKKILVGRGYREEDFVYNLRREFSVNEENFTMTAELAVRINGKNLILFKFERSTRFITPLERRTIAIARIIDREPFPFVILTNGDDCVFMDAINGRSMECAEIPSRDEAVIILGNLRIKEIEEEIEKEKRIFAAIDAIKCETCE